MAMNDPSTLSFASRSYIQTQTPSPRCSQCTPREVENSRNLILCIDSPSTINCGSKNTNVAKLFAQLNLESTQPEQYAYYSGGVDARSPRSSQAFDRIERVFSDKVDSAWNTKEIVKDAYRWLTRMYKEGDQIFLFGFSRGAYQVRVFAEMIHEVGLVRTISEDMIGTAYDYYEAICSGRSKIRHIVKLKDEHTRKDLRVHFVGVWDTISPSDHMKRNLSLPMSLAHACQFRHALALDELRVDFIPEYFHKLNSQADERESECLGKKVISEFKEVWFAGSHSDVGGQNTPGTLHHAGNVSLLWMRREAAANGLVLRPTDIVWLPHDLDLGVNDHARWFHRLQPRRILPGQKIHASVLYANAYKPKATLGEGFDIPITQSGLDVMVQDDEYWETGLFDGTAAQELVASLSNEQGVAPIYLDRLLFLLRSHEGKQYIRNIPDWQDNFMTIINGRDYVPLVRLVVIVAYFEASCDHEVHPNQCVLLPTGLSQSMHEDAKSFLDVIQDGPRVIGLLRSLTKHRILVEQFLTREVIDNLVNSLDQMILEQGRKFGKAMDCLNCLLQCVDIRGIVVAKLGDNLSDSNLSRLSRILEVEDPRLLTAALRMTRTLAGIPEANVACSVVKSRIKMLARTDEQPLGLLAIEVLLSLYDPNNQSMQRGEHSLLLPNASDQLDICDANTLTNLARALVFSNFDGHSLVNDQGRGASPAQLMLRKIFGLDATRLDGSQRNLIGELKTAAQMGSDQERTVATMALLKLCETENIRTHLCSIKLLDVFVRQLRRKESALLAAYALATCRKYGEMEESIKDNEELPGYVINMLKLNYIDDAVGRVEGVQIFKDLMQCADLWKKINSRDLADILSAKLGKDDPQEIRMGLICLNIIRSFDASGRWTGDLVEAALGRLNDSDWATQLEGVRILSALARTEHGKMVIGPRIQEIIEMLLPQDYFLIRPTVSRAASPSNEGRIVAMTPKPPQARSRDVPPSWMLGAACALRILAQSETLRNRTRETIQYDCLKDLFLSGALVSRRDTPVWRLGTPTRADVIDMLYLFIKVVDRERSEGSRISVEDVVPLHIQRWDSLARLPRDVALAVITALPQLWESVLLILASVLSTPIYVSVWVYEQL